MRLPEAESSQPEVPQLALDPGDATIECSAFLSDRAFSSGVDEAGGRPQGTELLSCRVATLELEGGSPFVMGPESNWYVRVAARRESAGTPSASRHLQGCFRQARGQWSTAGRSLHMGKLRSHEGQDEIEPRPPDVPLTVIGHITMANQPLPVLSSMSWISRFLTSPTAGLNEQ